MNEFAFQFAVLRYIHDPATEEFLNVGVVVYSREARYLRAVVNMRYSRLSDAFQEINGDHYRRVVHYIERCLAERHYRLQQLELFDELPAQIETILGQVLPAIDSSLVFGGYGGGITADLEAELNRLYKRLVERYTEREQDYSRTDQQVWQIYSQEFDKHNITPQLAPVTIRTPTYHYEFEHAWKNGRWQPLEPISFDLLHERSILEKANRWIGRATMLADSEEIGTLHMLLGSPHRRELQPAYQKALRNLKAKLPAQLKVEMIEEEEAAGFSARLGERMGGH
jgi:hypothetical protein